MAKELTKDQLNSIKNYSDQIVTLEKFVDQVRQTKGMYVGEIGNKGVITMFREILQNAIDEIMRTMSPCDRIKVTFDEASCTFIIEDNGRGIPLGHIIRIYASQHTSSNYTKKPGEYTSGMNGVGGKIVNALSTKFIIESYVLGEARRVEFNDGEVWDKGELVIPNKDNRQGTLVMFTPAFDVLGGNITVTYKDILGLIRMIVPLTPKGSKVDFKAILPGGKEITDTVISEDGIMTFIYDTTQAPIINPIVFSADNGKTRANVVLTFDSVGTEEIITSFCNFCITSSESTHVTGFVDGVVTFFRKYMNTIYLANGSSDKKKKKAPLVVNAQDIKIGLRAAIDAAHLEPIFTGQAKEKLSNKDMGEFMKQITNDALDAWSKNNPTQLQKICKYFKDLAELRTKSDEGRVKLSNQYKSTMNGLPAKFKDANKKRVELFIVEGDSAAGSFSGYRDNDTQAVFPIRGKIINCYTELEAKCLQNAEVSGILMILCGGTSDKNYGKNFDSTKVPWEKIIFCGDADSGGKAINALLLRLVLRFCPKLIEEGRVYKTVPPLYCVKIGKNMQYFSDRVSYVKYVQKVFSKKNELSTLKGKALSTLETTEFLYHNIDYIYELNKVSNRYHIDPKLLELYLYYKDATPAQLLKIIKSKYRFMGMSTIKGIVTIEGVIDLKYNTLFITDRLLAECKLVLDIMNSNVYLDYKLNGENSTLYEIMHKYENTQPANVTRLKGLGEQDGKELAESVISPQGGRTLIRYTIIDAKKEIEEIRVFENDKSKLLEHIGNITRFDIME